MSYLTYKQFQEHLSRMREVPYLAVDTEGTLNHPYSQTWGLSTSAYGSAQYFAFNHQFGNNLPQEWLPEIKEVIENHPCLIFHHAKHDLRALKNLDIDYTGPFYCTMLMGHMTNEHRFNQGLDALSRSFGGVGKYEPDEWKALIKAFGYKCIPVEMWIDYAIQDARATEELFYPLKNEFDEQDFDGELWGWEQKFVRLLMGIENRGLLIDQELSEHELKRGTQIMQEIRSYLGFNPGSTAELGKFLIDELNMPVLDWTPKKKPCFNKKVMTAYEEMLNKTNDDRATKILVYRGWQKVVGSNYRPYLEKLSPEDGRLRSEYKMHGTVSGRLSCSYFQQIPKMGNNDWNGKLKKTFIVDRGRTGWEFDYKQLEFRLGAAYGQVSNLINLLNNSEVDVFTEMSRDLSMTRDHVKTLVYLMQYHGGPDKVETTFGVSKLAARGILAKFFNQYPGLKRISNLAEIRAKQNGFIKYWTNRRSHFPYKDEAWKAFSRLIQGGAFEIVKRQMIRLDEAGLNNDECAMDLQVHDSVRFDIEDGKEDKYIPEIVSIMEDVESLADFGVKFPVSVKKWGEK